MAHDGGHQETAEMQRIDRDALIPAAPEDVWMAITGAGWLADHVELELTPGGDARFSDPGLERTGWVEEAQPPSGDGEGRLVFWWGPEGEPATRVELTLAPDGDTGTRLRVVESRPLEVLDLVGLPLPGQDGITHGPAMLAAV
jgi:uncharacterized protein YndB with AHSA1/START domain